MKYHIIRIRDGFILAVMDTQDEADQAVGKMDRPGDYRVEMVMG